MLSIIWTELAIEDLSENILFLENQWTEKEIIKFSNKVNELLNKLLQGNIKFKPTEYENVFMVVITKQITLFYELDNNNIILMRFWNNYKNPLEFKLL